MTQNSSDEVADYFMKIMLYLSLKMELLGMGGVLKIV